MFPKNRQSTPYRPKKHAHVQNVPLDDDAREKETLNATTTTEELENLAAGSDCIMHQQ